MDSKIWKVLSRLEEQANLERSGESTVPHDDRMLAITADTGMFFNIILRAMKARKILEIGTSTGYSTLWFADAIKHNLNDTIRKPIITIDENTSKVQRANKNFTEGGVKNIIDIREGQAKSILSKMLKNQNNKNDNDLFDFVFIDADKENTIDYFDMCLPMVKVGGIIAVDNMLLPEHFASEMTKYANYVRAKPNVQTVTVPVGNGEEITIKTS
ncbi:MAG: O-methyltransferase [Nitrosopumilaceae archaeon]